MSDQVRLPENFLDHCIRRHGMSVVEILHDIQQQCNHLPEAVLRDLARKTRIPLVHIYRIATFYNSFSLAPRGRHQVLVCGGTTCHVRGAAHITDEISRVLGIGSGDITPDGEFSLDTANCLGCCAFAPVMVVDGKYYGNLKPSDVRRILSSLKAPARASVAHA